jgi:hypothetical protein
VGVGSSTSVRVRGVRSRGVRSCAFVPEPELDGRLTWMFIPEGPEGDCEVKDEDALVLAVMEVSGPLLSTGTHNGSLGGLARRPSCGDATERGVGLVRLT